MAEILTSVIGVSSSSRHTLAETSAIRPKAGGISLTTVASTSLPFDGLNNLTLDWSGRLGWAIASSSSFNSCVTFPCWTKLLVCVDWDLTKGVQNIKPNRNANKSRFTAFHFS